MWFVSKSPLTSAQRCFIRDRVLPPTTYSAGLVVQKQNLEIFHSPPIFWNTISSWFASGPPPPALVFVLPTDVVRAKAQSALVGTISSILILLGRR